MQHAHFPLRHSHCLPLTPALIVRTTDLIQMLSLASAPLGFAPVGLAAPGRAVAPAVRMAAIDDLQSLAKEANPIVGYWDPLNLALLNFWDQGDDATVVRPNSGAPVVPAATITPTEAHTRCTGLSAPQRDQARPHRHVWLHWVHGARQRHPLPLAHPGR